MLCVYDTHVKIIIHWQYESKSNEKLAETHTGPWWNIFDQNMQINLNEPIFTPKVKKTEVVFSLLPWEQSIRGSPSLFYSLQLLHGSHQWLLYWNKKLDLWEWVKRISPPTCLPVYHSCQVEHWCTRSSSQHTDKNLSSTSLLPPASTRYTYCTARHFTAAVI